MDALEDLVAKRLAGREEATDAIRRAARALGEEVPEQDAPTGRESTPAPDLSPVARPSGEHYHPRPLGARSDVEALRAARGAQIAVLLAGRPGCGKTALAEAAHPDLVTVAGHADLEVADLVGTYAQEDDGSFTWVDGPLVVAMREGRCLFIDDCTLIPPGVIARIYPVLDGRGMISVSEHRGEVVEAAEGFCVIGAHNPDAPGAILSEALSSRFSLQVEVESDLALAKRLGVDRRVVRASAALAAQRRAGEITWSPEMREMLAFTRISLALDEDAAASALISQAPEECRDEVAAVVRTWFPAAEPLRLAGD